MLQIKDIRKTYITGELVQTALDGVSLNLRDNEFVAILGPSGSGKTTLLNVIGGLDRYDSGDLIINGISTKKYSDRDWDSYRNHTIGFVFQSYNLIPHQSVLANVELALTISGISRAERRRRAAKALSDVGLGNQLHKKPNQMSGGQMQRVAIARALVNDPDILLADEPTGALDSETSVQVMELLKEVSRDRLVVMVTHNPELAEDYANRIVRVKDGKIIGDTNPFPVDEQTLAEPEHRNMGKSSMSFWTAMALSFNNLRTKKARTLLTAFAGSIGIIGIALIMSLSTGFQKYIDKIQADTLSNYPLSIQTETSDMSSMFAAFGASVAQSREAPDGTVVEQQLIAQMFAQIGTNDLGSFKAHLEEHYDEIDHAVSTIKYSYGVQPRIYLADTTKGIMQANPATLMSELMGNSLLSSMMSTDVFYEMIDNRELLESQYEVIQGRWPEDYTEMVVVLSDPRQITDFMAYTLGLKEPELLESVMEAVMDGKEVESVSETEQWTYDDLMAVELRLVDVSDLYEYNPEYNLWEDMSENKAHMQSVIEAGEPLSIVGIVCAREGVSATALSTGVAYTSDLTRHVIARATDSALVKAQQADLEMDVFSGSRFDEKKESELDFENMISVDSEAITSAFGMDISTDSLISMLRGYLSEVLNSTQVDTTPAQNAFKEAFRTLSVEMLRQYVQNNGDENGQAWVSLADVEPIVDAYLATPEAQEQMKALSVRYGASVETYQEVYRPLMVALLTTHIAEEVSGRDLMALGGSAGGSEMEEIEVTPPDESEEQEPVDPEISEPEQDPPDSEPEEPEQNPPESEEDQEPEQPEIEIDPSPLRATIQVDEIETIVEDYLNAPAVSGVASAMGMKMMEGTIRSVLMDKVSEFGGRLAAYIGQSFHVDGDKIAAAFQFNMTEEEIQRLMMAMAGQVSERSGAANLKMLGYADLAQPSAMSVYLADFAAKEEFIAFLDAYNQAMLDQEREEQVIQYTDVTGMMMSSVRTIIDSVSYALIAFVAVSLVVSSIMIGIITYISVMERTKEIGILRAIGASKRNISQVFNAETFIIGLCSGLIGIGITLLLLIPGNMLILHLTENPDIVAQLPWQNAVILIGLSVILTLIGGFIPAKQAAKKDPVIALRSE